MSTGRKDLTRRRGDAEKKRRRRKECKQQLCVSAPLREIFLKKWKF
jgi:hypothetical protein